MHKLEELIEQWDNLSDDWEFHNYAPKIYKQLIKVDNKIVKMRKKILKLYIGDKSNAPNVLLYSLQEEAQNW